MLRKHWLANLTQWSSLRHGVCMLLQLWRDYFLDHKWEGQSEIGNCWDDDSTRIICRCYGGQTLWCWFVWFCPFLSTNRATEEIPFTSLEGQSKTDSSWKSRKLACEFRLTLEIKDSLQFQPIYDKKLNAIPVCVVYCHFLSGEHSLRVVPSTPPYE